MNTFFKFLGACSFGLSAACLFWLAVEPAFRVYAGLPDSF